jgi:hypothetical protein
VDAFQAAYRRGQVTTPPDAYMDLILIPSILHIDPVVFMGYPPAIKAQTRNLLMAHIHAGHALNTSMIEAK